MAKKRLPPEGRRLKSLDPMSMVSPYIMTERNGASNMIRIKINVARIEEYIRQKRAEGLDGFGIMHVLVAAYVRAVSQRPALNRFIRGQKIFARNDIVVMLTIKRSMSTVAEETIIKAHFTPDMTAEQIYRGMNDVIESSRGEESDFDDTAKFFRYIPGLLLKFAIWFLKLLDYFGLMPRSLCEVSPFHGSMFITSMGSLGIPAIYHHLYNFGDVSQFCAFGAKEKVMELDRDGSPVERHYIEMLWTLDERICDGFYYASGFKLLRGYLQNPWVLDAPPADVKQDVK